MKSKRKNVTLSLPDDLLKKVKHIAVEKDTSLSGFLTKTLYEIVQKEEGYQVAAMRNLKLLEKGLNLGTKGTTSWKREDLYDV